MGVCLKMQLRKRGTLSSEGKRFNGRQPLLVAKEIKINKRREEQKNSMKKKNGRRL